MSSHDCTALVSKLETADEVVSFICVYTSHDICIQR